MYPFHISFASAESENNHSARPRRPRAERAEVVSGSDRERGEGSEEKGEE